MAGSVTITGLSASEPAGERVLGPLTTEGNVIIGETWSGSLNQGDNTIAVPAGSVGVVIIPPEIVGGTALTYRTNVNSTDGGLPISPSFPMVHVFASTIPTSIIVNATAAQAAFLEAWFW